MLCCADCKASSCKHPEWSPFSSYAGVFPHSFTYDLSVLSPTCGLNTWRRWTGLFPQLDSFCRDARARGATKIVLTFPFKRREPRRPMPSDPLLLVAMSRCSVPGSPTLMENSTVLPHSFFTPELVLWFSVCDRKCMLATGGLFSHPPFASPGTRFCVSRPSFVMFLKV